MESNPKGLPYKRYIAYVFGKSMEDSSAWVIPTLWDTKSILDSCLRPDAVFLWDVFQAMYGSSMIDGGL